MSARSENEARPPVAVALRWDEAARRAPAVVAKGRGEIAERILAVARAHDLPVEENADLLPLLAACDVGEEIPVELYRAVAELLAWLARLNASLASRCAPDRVP